MTFSLTTTSTKASGHEAAIQRIFQAALQAVNPYTAVLQALTLDNSNRLFIKERFFDLNVIERIIVVGAGKAGSPMVRAVVDRLGKRISKGNVVVKDGYAQDISSPVQILSAAHPIPDNRGVQAAQQIIHSLHDTGPNDLVIALISGGGSALLTSPAEGITLADLQSLTRALLTCGASIQEINTLRKHLDTLKGGGLARLASPANLVTLILSDVIGDPLDVIASGPTVPDSTSFQDAYSILKKYRIEDQIPASILERLRAGVNGQIADTPKPADPLFSRVYNTVIASNQQAARAALEQAQAEGMNAFLLTTFLQGDARNAGPFLASIARQIDASSDPLPRPACVIAGGETTVVLHGNGLGGRNQEMALSTVNELAGLPDTLLACLATDGGDGPTDAAGAVVTGETLKRAQNAGLDPRQYLSANDSYHFFEPLGDLFKPGPTMTNVNDLAFLFLF
jgi:hydroxypyruvate reductase